MTPDPTVASRAPPRLRIPRIGVDAPVVPVQSNNAAAPSDSDLGASSLYTPVPLHVLSLPANEDNRRGSIISTEERPQSIDPTVTAPMADTEPQTAGGKVLWHFTMSPDGFVAGPSHAMDWMTGTSFRSGLVEEYVETTGAVLGGRRGFDAYPEVSGIYGGAWRGPVFVLTHHPEDAQSADGVTFLSCDVAGAVRIGLGAPAARTSRSSRPRSADSSSSAD